MIHCNKMVGLRHSGGICDCETWGTWGNIAMEYDLYIGTYTSQDAPGCDPHSECGEGIYHIRLAEDVPESIGSAAGGAIRMKAVQSVCYAAENPSYLVLDQSGEYLYAVSETDEHGAVLCCRVEKDGALTFLERYEFEGGASCHLTVTRDNQYLAVSDYVGGCVTIFRRHENGQLVPEFQHKNEGSGPVKERQAGPHAHSTLELSDGRLVCADLGSDRLIVFERISDGRMENSGAREAGKDGVTSDKATDWKAKSFWQLPAGTGPRHMALSADGRFLYVLTELSCEVYLLDVKKEGAVIGCWSVRYRAEREVDVQIQIAGRAAEKQVESGGSEENVPNRMEGKDSEENVLNRMKGWSSVQDRDTENLSADIHLSDCGKYLYVSNRGLDSIVIFGIEENTGKLVLTGVYPSGGKNPRNFALDDKYIWITNQVEAGVAAYRLTEQGKIGEQVYRTAVPRASCILIRSVDETNL